MKKDALQNQPFPEIAMAREFVNEGISRRDFMRLLGSTIALAGVSGLAGCVRQPQQEIVPYIDQPERLIPGKPLFYATALEFMGFGRGVLVETHEARPTKVEGNALHPASLGATSLFEQATILDLYNPARSSSPLRSGETASWPAFLAELQKAMAELPSGGAGIHLLTGTITSPTFEQQWQTLTQRYPEAQWHQYEPINFDAELEGSNQAFGKYFQTHYHFEKAKVIVSFGSDFLFAMPGSVRYARDFIAGRDPQKKASAMNRLYVLESAPTITGASADHRHAVAPAAMIDYAIALARKLNVGGWIADASPSREADEWASGVASDLKTSGEPSLILAGAATPPELHALVHAMNQALGNHGKAVSYSAPVQVQPVNNGDSIKALASAIENGTAKVLFMLDGDWAHTAPADLNLEALIRRVPFSVHLGSYVNPTARAARWHIPKAHPLEAWSDIRAFDGTATIAQPMIEPLFGGKTLHELLDCIANYPGRSAFDIIKEHWTRSGMDENAWRRALHDGVVPDSQARPQTPKIKPAQPIEIRSPSAAPATLVFTPDYGLWDGRFSENAWLQELPRPISRLSWENAFLVHPATAAASGLRSGDVIRVKSHGGRELRGAVLLQPGMADGVYALSLGCGPQPEPGLWFKGATPAGVPIEIDKTAQNTGINAYPIRTGRSPWSCAVEIEKTQERHEPATTQEHHVLNGPNVLRITTKDQAPTSRQETHQAQGFYNLTRSASDGIAWGMVIDLTRCIGCNACVAACQAENNIPPVGRNEVIRGREMHWIRIDSYYLGDDPKNPRIAFQPVPCMHCETAPCELVCPVGATLHDHEGLNVQVYNRCIGTRYCSNNCPYKVRRFNFFNYAKQESKEPLLLSQNPNVTVRTRGVMEKCTYCVQRITTGRIKAEVEKRPIRDGEIIPACAQACPTQAIVFGNLGEKTRVAALAGSALNYSLLEELNTKPRTTYLMRVTNPRPS